MADDSKVNLMGSKSVGDEKHELELAEAGCNQDAQDICPVQCIHVEK